MVRRNVVAALLAAGLLAGCTGDDGQDDAVDPTPTATDPQDLIDAAKVALDETSSVRFVLTSAEVPSSGTVLLGGQGVIARPDAFEGEIQILLLGSQATINLISVDGTVYAQLPFQSGYSETDPDELGLRDPGTLIDPDTGLSQLLAAAEDPVLGEEVRVDGEVLRELSATLPGEVVGDLLANADPSQDVPATLAISADSGELRRAVLTGPFYEAETDSTFTIVLDEYGADVDITAPTD
ncbi:N/A [soil metagenome]